MEEEEKLPKKKTLCVGIALVLMGTVCVMCNVAIQYLPHYEYPVRSSSYGIWGGLTFLLSGLAVMNATRGYSQAAVSTGLSTVSAGMGLVVTAIGAMAVHDGLPVIVGSYEKYPPTSTAIARLSLDVVITFLGLFAFLLSIISHRLTVKSFRKYIRQLQEQQQEEAMNEFANMPVTFNARDETCSVPISPPPYTPAAEPYPPPPAYTETPDTPAETTRLGSHQMNRSTESLVS